MQPAYCKTPQASALYQIRLEPRIKYTWGKGCICELDSTFSSIKKCFFKRKKCWNTEWFSIIFLKGFNTGKWVGVSLFMGTVKQTEPPPPPPMLYSIHGIQAHTCLCERFYCQYRNRQVQRAGSSHLLTQRQSVPLRSSVTASEGSGTCRSRNHQPNPSW